MKSYITILFVLFILSAIAQPYYRQVYFDKEKKMLKATYQMQDTISNIYDGTFETFFESGKTASKGQFEKNAAKGNWEFYYESGSLKMKGPYHNNVNQGVWEFYYESGGKSMEGELRNNAKEGLWKLYYEGGKLKETGMYKNNVRIGEWQTFYERGELKSRAAYQNSMGRVTEFYPSGKKKGEGMQENLSKSGGWKYYSEEGKLIGEGGYVEGKKSGLWNEFFDNGKPASQGMYVNDEPIGNWTYFYEDGKRSAEGAYEAGKRVGLWQSFSLNGALESEAHYEPSTGEYTEHYPSHKIKMKGQLENDKRTGLWIFYAENGAKEGDCFYTEGKGIFSGFYPNGALKNKGSVEDDRRVGQWELYDTEGKLTGYYKPIYQAPDLKMQSPMTGDPMRTTSKKTRLRQFFTPRYPEYKSVIVSANPLFSLLGFMPFNLEFYAQERIGYEFMLESIRHPFFVADKNILPRQIYVRGVSFRFRQKFYFPTKFGMIYAAHSIGSIAVQHLVNYSTPIRTISAREQVYEYGVMIGNRLMRHNGRDGFTIDGYIGYSIGFRQFTTNRNFNRAFSSVNQDKFVPSFHFGLTFGYSISFSE